MVEQGHRSKKNVSEEQMQGYMKAIESNHDAVTGDFYKGFAHDSKSADSSCNDRRGRFFQTAPMPAGSSPALKKAKVTGEEGANDDDNEDAKAKDAKKRDQLVDPNKCAKAYSALEPAVLALDELIRKAEALKEQASSVLSEHAADRVFGKLKEGLEIRYKIFCFLVHPLDSEQCRSRSARPDGAAAWTLQQELEALSQKDLRFMPVGIAEMVHRSALGGKLDMLFDASTNGELADRRKEVTEAINSCKKVILTLEKQAQEIIGADKSKKAREQAAKDKMRKQEIEAEGKAALSAQKRVEERAKVLQEQKEAITRAEAKQAPVVKLGSVCVDPEIFAGALDTLKLDKAAVDAHRSLVDPEVGSVLASLGDKPLLITNFTDAEQLCSKGPAGASFQKFRDDYPSSTPIVRSCRVSRSTPEDVGKQIACCVLDFLSNVPHLRPMPVDLKDFAYTSWFANTKGMKHVGLDGVSLPSIRVHLSGKRDVVVVRASELYKSLENPPDCNVTYRCASLNFDFQRCYLIF